MTPLSPKTEEHIRALFDAGDRDTAAQMILHWAADSERLRFAAIRLSEGDLDKLRYAIEVGERDFRDLLVFAGFGDVHAHEAWVARSVTPEIIERWRSGKELAGVRFRPNEVVEVYGGEHPPGITGSVVSLTGFEPEPQYKVVLASGKEIGASESWLWKAG
jgi:hypothetical protein